MASNEDEGILITQQTSLDDRIAAARDAADRLRLTMPILVDGMGNDAAAAFAAWPERLVVIGADGLVVYPGAPGPFGFSPDEAEARIATLVAGAET